MSSTPLGFRDILAIAPLRRLLIAQLVSVFGDFLAVFAVFSVATFRLNASAAEISMILVAFLLPLGVVSPLAGVLVDRWNLKRTMIGSDLARAALVLVLVWTPNLPGIYAVFFALSVVSSFFMPAQAVVLRTLTPPQGLLAANALMSQAVQVTQILTPAIAGVLVAWTGPAFCFYFDAASFLFSALLVARITIPAPETHAERKLGSVVSELTIGLRFIFTHSALSFVIVSMTVGMFAIRCFGALLAVYVRDVLAQGSVAFGGLNSLIGIGMIGGTQFVHRYSARRSRDSLVLFGLIAAGVFILVLALFGTVATAVLGMLGLGLGVVFIFIPAQTLIQEVTPTNMLGRVSSSMMSALALTQVVALSLSGAAAAAIGIRNLYLASAVLLMMIAAAGHWRLAGERARLAAGTGVADGR